MGQTGSFSVSRRRLLWGGAASAIAVGLASKLSFDYLTGQDAWIEKILRKNLPGIKLDEGSLALFFRDIRAKGILQALRHRSAVLVDQTVPAPTNWVGKLHRANEGRERLVLSEFLLGSNFFRTRDPTRETITYYGGSSVCGNPFAVFRDA